ncbi:MAG TPA: hypothetical protein DCR27_06285 [Lachnospiraceae bacterium]|nr:hypothetical protein [Lachnospiraceae bacterium]
MRVCGSFKMGGLVMSVGLRRCRTLLEYNGMFVVVMLFILIAGGHLGGQTAKLMLAQIFFILLPGFSVLKQANFAYRNKVVFGLCAYATGYLLSILIYAVFLLFGAQQFSAVGYVVYAVGCIILFVKTRHKRVICREDIAKAEYLLLLVLLAVALIIGIAVYQLPNRSALIVDYRYMVGDLTYWFKNCVAATKGYPLPELSISGLNLYWHLFSCFEVAFLHFLTGIEIYELCFTFAYIWQIFLLVGGTYVIAVYFLRKRSYIFLVLPAVLFTSGMDNQTWVFYQYHLYRCSLAFIEGYAMSMFGLFFFFAFMDLNKKNYTAYALTVLMLAGALGLKASGGVILLAGMAVRGVLYLGKNAKKNLKYILMIISYFLVFYVVANFVLIDGNALSSSTSSHRLNLFTIESVFKSGHYRPLYDTLRVGFLNKYFAYAVTVFLYLIHANYAIFVPLMVGFIVTIFQKNWKNFMNLTSVC